MLGDRGRGQEGALPGTTFGRPAHARSPRISSTASSRTRFSSLSKPFSTPVTAAQRAGGRRARRQVRPVPSQQARQQAQSAARRAELTFASSHTLDPDSLVHVRLEIENTLGMASLRVDGQARRRGRQQTLRPRHGAATPSSLHAALPRTRASPASPPAARAHHRRSSRVKALPLLLTLVLSPGLAEPPLAERPDRPRVRARGGPQSLWRRAAMTKFGSEQASWRACWRPPSEAARSSQSHRPRLSLPAIFRVDRAHKSPPRREMARGLVSALSAAALAACLAAPAGAFYVPGTTPVDFKNDDPVSFRARSRR